jgi:hypothetical protein
VVSYGWRGPFRNAELHVDFEPELGPFYWASCGFRPTTAGLIAL